MERKGTDLCRAAAFFMGRRPFPFNHAGALALVWSQHRICTAIRTAKRTDVLLSLLLPKCSWLGGVPPKTLLVFTLCVKEKFASANCMQHL